MQKVFTFPHPGKVVILPPTVVRHSTVDWNRMLKEVVTVVHSLLWLPGYEGDDDWSETQVKGYRKSSSFLFPSSSLFNNRRKILLISALLLVTTNTTILNTS